ncbi:MAG: heme ABC transporter ATP-binding protein [Sorangiineae bacterium PRO1]|nr:heme ABC transporter ATP-binding protein [Sorangiineae bacterium PRO1]
MAEPNLRARPHVGPESGTKLTRVSDVTPAIEARAVSAGYGRSRVLSEVSIAARAGELVAVLGPNGAGKSTLMRVLAGTLAPDAGAVLLSGRDLTTLSRAEIARVLGVVPQDSDVAFGFSVRDVVTMGRAPHQSGLLWARPEDERAVERALSRCDIAGLGSRRVAELSGGERRRVTIARALAQEPRVLLLDEPAAHLDARHAVSVGDLVKGEVVERGVACIAVMHDLAAAARWADRIVLLTEGRVRADGPPPEVLEAALLESVFEIPIRVGEDAETRLPYVVTGRLSK